MPSYGATSTGFVPATLDEIRTEMLDALALVTDKSGGHPFVNASDDSVLQQVLSICADGLQKCWNAAWLVANQFDPAQAVGQYLTALVQLNGLLRKPGAKTRIELDLDGVAGTVVPAGSVFTDATRQHAFALDADATLPASGVSATATEYGSWVPAPGDVALIQSSLPGLRSVTNTAVLAPGEDRETDAALRFRQSVSTAFPGRSTIESLYAGVMQISGVTFARAYQNLGPLTDGRGIPPHEVCVCVVGGDDAEIAEVLFNRFPIGKVGWGNTTVTVTDSIGEQYDISFLRPEAVRVQVLVRIHPKPPDYMVGTYADDIKAAILEYARTGGPGNQFGFPPGADVVRTRLMTPINDSPGFSVESLWLRRFGGAWAQTDLAIAWNEAPSFAAADITVEIV